MERKECYGFWPGWTTALFLYNMNPLTELFFEECEQKYLEFEKDPERDCKQKATYPKKNKKWFTDESAFNAVAREFKKKNIPLKIQALDERWLVDAYRFTYNKNDIAIMR